MNLKELELQINQFEQTTDRLVVRRHIETDFADIMKLEQNPEVMRYIKDIDDDVNVIAKFVRESFIDWQAEDGKWKTFGVFLKDTDTFIGNVFVRFESLEFGRAEIGYRFHPNVQGKGYATEVMKPFLNWLWTLSQVNKVLAYCVAENTASYRLMEKLGMKREGILRQHSTLGGKWYDELVYGVLREDVK